MLTAKIKKELRKQASEAAKKAYSPYSNVLVGSSILTDKDEFFSGCNIENSSFGATVCAERVAIFHAIKTNPKNKIKLIYIYTDAGWPPCGICRQVLAEFSAKELKVIIGNKKGEEKVYTLDEIFPLAFTPDHLIKK